MAQTMVRGTQVLDHTIQRDDLDTSTVGNAVIAKVIQGTNVTISSTGADSGTGDVTISVPTGGQGPAGTNSFTITSTGFTVPAVGSTTTVTVNDASWAVVGEMVNVGSAGGGGNSGMLQITAIAGNTLTLLNPPAVPTIPLADTTQSGLLRQASGNTTDFADGTNHYQNLVTAIQPTIWSMRLRSLNCVANPTFEVDQINVGTSVAIGAPLKTCDRWSLTRTGTAVGTVIANQNNNSLVPGTNFRISRASYDVSITTAQATLAAGDLLYFQQLMEGPQLREIIDDVFSISILCSSTVAPVTFTFSLYEPVSAQSYGKLLTLSTANTKTLLTIPNIPKLPTQTIITPSVLSLYLRIGLAAGTTYTGGTDNTWTAGNFVCVPTSGNFAANVATFSTQFIQLEPGPQATTLIDKPWPQNYDECLRYYWKGWDYDVAPGTGTAAGSSNTWQNSTTSFQTNLRWAKSMAKVPTVTVYNWNTGAANQLLFGGVAYAVSAVGGVSKGGMNSITISSAAPAPVAGATASVHLTADTGW